MLSSFHFYMIRVGFHVWLCAKHYAMNRYANRSDMFSKVREVKMERYLSKISWENAHVRNYDMAEFVMQCSDFICFISLIFKYHYISKDAKTGYLVDFEYKPKRVNPTSHVFMVNNQVKYDSI